MNRKFFQCPYCSGTLFEQVTINRNGLETLQPYYANPWYALKCCSCQSYAKVITRIDDAELTALLESQRKESK